MRDTKRGFTLIEAMLVVTLVGILAVLAVYGVRKYVTRSKTVEARAALGGMGKGALIAYEKETMPSGVLPEGSIGATSRSLCGSASSTVPATLSSISGKKYQSSQADWRNQNDVKNGAGFPCLRFSIDSPQHFAYGYTTDATSTTNGKAGNGNTNGCNGNGNCYGIVGTTSSSSSAATSFTATANGDLNGDGVFSTFSLMGVITPEGRLKLAPTIGEVMSEE